MIKELNTHYSFTNPATVHDEEALTALELAGRTTAKVNEVVRAQNTLAEQTLEHLENQDKTIEERMDIQDGVIEEMRTVKLPEDVAKEFQKNVDNGVFEEVVEEHFGNLEERLENLLGNVPEGGTSMDAEIVDARMGAFGSAPFSSLGQSNREQFSALQNMIHSLTVNDKNILLSFLWESGGINNGNGELVESSNFARTASYIPYVEGMFVTVKFLKPALLFVNKYVDGVWSFEKIYQKDYIFVMQDNIRYRFVVSSPTEGEYVTPSNVGEYVQFYGASNHVSYEDLLRLQSKIVTLKPEATLSGLLAYNSGLVGANESCRVTDFTPITGYRYIQYKSFLNDSGAVVAFYDKNQNYLKNISVAGASGGVAKDVEGLIDLTDAIYRDAVYVRFCVFDNTQVFNNYDFVVSNNESLDAKNRKTINVLGDSITSVDYTIPTWWGIIASSEPYNFNNYGQSGTTLAHTDARHNWDMSFNTEELPDYDPDDPSTWESGNCFVERVDEMDTSADGVIVLGGTNDGGVPRGAWDSTDTSTFFGALNVLFTRLIQSYAGKPILICTMPPSRDGYGSNVADPLTTLLNKSDGDKLSLQLRAEAIKAKCRQYSLPCVDLYNQSGFNHADYYRTNDTLHPSAVGQRRIACLVQDALETYFKY